MPEETPAQSGAAEPLQAPAYSKPASTLESLLSRTVSTPPGMAPDGTELAQEPPEPETDPNPQAIQDPRIKGSVEARLRIVEREKRLEAAKAKEWEDRFKVLAKIVEDKQVDEEEVVEEDLDPISRLSKQNQAISQKLDNVVAATKQEKDAMELARLESMANDKILEFSKRADGVRDGLYREAASHLVNVWMSEELEDTDLPLKEAQNKVAKKLTDMKIKYLLAGKNPGEEFFKRSVLHGFQVPQQTAGAQSAQQGKPDAKTQIDKQAKKKDALASLSNVNGSPQHDGVKDLSKLDGNEYFRRVTAMAKEKYGTMRKTIPIEERLAHKLR